MGSIVDKLPKPSIENTKSIVFCYTWIVFFLRIRNYFYKNYIFPIWPKISYMLEFWKNNNNNHKYNHPKNISKKKSYFLKINMKNSKINRRTIFFLRYLPM